jgi:hypothetical protein
MRNSRDNLKRRREGEGRPRERPRRKDCGNETRSERLPKRPRRRGGKGLKKSGGQL